jgi:hypothetical protein
MAGSARASWLIAFVLAGALAPAPAHGDFRTARELQAFCSDPSPLKQAMCLSYLQGIADGLQARAIGVPNLCLPGDVGARQLADTALAILRQAPALDQNEAVVPLAPGFAKRWACRDR